MPDRRPVILPLLLTLLLATGCTSVEKLSIPPLEEALGVGWKCYTVPDSFKKAGVVVEVTRDNRYVHFLDHSLRSTEGTSAIGKLQYRKNYSLDALAQTLVRFGLLEKADQISAQGTQSHNVLVSFGKTRKYVVDGDDIKFIMDEMKRRDLNPSSRYIVFRESHATNSVSMHIDAKKANSLNVDLKLTGIVGPTLSVHTSNSSAYELKEIFGDLLGICTIATELEIRRGFDGATDVTLGKDLRLPSDVVIQKE